MFVCGDWEVNVADTLYRCCLLVLFLLPLFPLLLLRLAPRVSLLFLVLCVLLLLIKRHDGHTVVLLWDL